MFVMIGLASTHSSTTKAFAILNPNQIADKTYPFKSLCGAGVAFKLVQGLIQKGEFKITEGALNFIVEKANEYKLGARGLRSLCEAILTDAMFELPESDVKVLEVTKDYAEQKLNNSSIKLKAVS